MTDKPEPTAEHIDAHPMTPQKGDTLINRLSEWVDDGLAWDDVAGVERTPEAMLLHRTQKIGEEYGEVVAAIIGATGANPRKGFTNGLEAVDEELLDVALTALAAWAHRHGNTADPIAALLDHIMAVATRAGVAP